MQGTAEFEIMGKKGVYTGEIRARDELLSDSTTIFDVPWSNLKNMAMKKDFKTSKWFVSSHVLVSNPTL